MDGRLAATDTASGVSLDLLDLHGDLMATVGVSTNSVLSTDTYTEFGAPETGGTGTYTWSAGSQRAASGQAAQILMGVRGYNPYLGRFDQRDPVPGGSANAYDFADQNPVNNADPTGRTVHFPHGHYSCGIATCTFYASRWGTEHMYAWVSDHGWTAAAARAAVGVILGAAMCEGDPWCTAYLGITFGLMASDIIDNIDAAHNHRRCFAMKTTRSLWVYFYGLIFPVYQPLYPENVSGGNCW